MLHLTRAIDRATGYVFVPPPDSRMPSGTVDNKYEAASRPNAFGLLASAAGPIRGPGSEIRDVQERWVDAREEWDAYEKLQWRKEGEIVRDEAARRSKAKGKG